MHAASGVRPGDLRNRWPMLRLIRFCAGCSKMHLRAVCMGHPAAQRRDFSDHYVGS